MEKIKKRSFSDAKQIVIENGKNTEGSRCSLQPKKGIRSSVKIDVKILE
jgi:hypothetical protein